MLLIFISCTEIEIESNIKDKNVDISKRPGPGFFNECDFNYGKDDDLIPKGGGASYANIILSSTANYYVSNLSELLVALDNALSGQVIYVADNADILITDPSVILKINEGVTLAGGRGNGSCGARIRTTVSGTYTGNCNSSTSYTAEEGVKLRSLFTFKGDKGRITGLIIEGPFSDVGDCNALIGKTGISTNGYDDITIDNNEIYGWPTSGVLVTNNENNSSLASDNNIKVTHNKIYHNRHKGFGYGVVIGADYCYALVKSNIFSMDSIDIASSGMPNSGYEASYNIVLGGNYLPNFDIHSNNDIERISGNQTYIHHNDFYDNRETQTCIVVDGVPKFMCLIEKNIFHYQDANVAVVSRHTKKNVVILNNVYKGQYKGWYVSRNWDKPQPYCYLPIVDSGMMPIAFGNFDSTSTGDEDTEIFTIDSLGKWLRAKYIKEEQILTASGRSNLLWNYIEGGLLDINYLIFKDFNGDGFTDIFKSDGGLWYVSNSAQHSWCTGHPCPYNIFLGIEINNVAFGNFTNPSDPNDYLNKTIDVFKANNGNWEVSYNGSSNWTSLNNAPGMTMDKIAFGDFNGDGKTDVFKANLVNWHVSYGGRTGWTYLNSSTDPLAQLIFVDINNDGKTDVLKKVTNEYLVSFSGTAPFVPLNYATSSSLINSW